MAVVAALVLALGYYLGNRLAGPDAEVPGSPRALLATDQPLDLGDLTLTDHYGAPFGAEQLAGRWSLLAFTHPTDVEQTRAALTRLVLVHNRLVDQPALQKLFLGLVVALDPVPDPGVLRELVDIDSPDFRGLSGNPEVLARLVPEPPSNGQPPGLAIVDPGHRLVGWFTADTPPATIAHDLKALARATAAD